jgi:AcrR family transcriptional regulator
VSTPRDRPRARGRSRRQLRDPDPTPIWAREETGTRRPARTREDIAEAAVAVADAEGFDAVSMRRVASELGVGTMTLYHYVRSKEDLLDLMSDVVFGEYLVPDAAVDRGWREGLSAIARATREAIKRHPWSLAGLRIGGPGPNGMRHAEQSLAAVRTIDADPMTRMELIGLVDDYVLGFAIRAQFMAYRARVAGVSDERWREVMLEYAARQLETGDFPHMQALVESQQAAGGRPDELMPIDDDDERFERGLRRVLDGIAAELAPPAE